jgi:DNA-binding transcriptional regulator YiaG
MTKGMMARPVSHARPSAVGQKQTARKNSPPLTVISGKSKATATQLRELRQALSPDPSKLLSQQRLSQLLGVSWSTIARWEGGGAIDARHALKLTRLQRVLSTLGEMVTQEHRLAFCEQAHPLLMGLRPIDLLETEEGTAAVLRHLEAAATGGFA